jgi:hypothetical protein
LPDLSVIVVRKTEKACNQKRSMRRLVRKKTAYNRVIEQGSEVRGQGSGIRKNIKIPIIVRSVGKTNKLDKFVKSET